ncbi:thiol reductant ABC exporter subunit CydC [Candidatus Kirkpatrickella diaphorinae]|uniref:Thiol reductant ABC exporter subunit CydC n=1 Tax=Candidatus Kirkpatrickella diaphorinae TaxID=2984322 RepID=A0ABY6GJV3_9PROT|nr:thiol reductant ABC exporter subunit CydC [Candidatus Kirkpatrickella diaphorinae]UYH51815.1 thiol reductant ABC exporter subunit CydC [Candidatus Kirkpatrickella diaphorinae]
MTQEHVTDLEKPAGKALSVFKPILHVWQPYKWRLTFGVILAILSALIGLTLMGSAAARVGVVGATALVSLLTLRLLGAGRVILRYFERLCAHDAMFRALTATRVWFFRHLARVSDHGMGFMRSGDMLSRLVHDVDALDAIYLRLITPFCAAIVTILAIIFFAGALSFTLAVTLGVIALGMVTGLPVLSASWTSRSGGDVLRAQGQLRSSGLDFAVGLREARIYGAQSLLEGRVHQDASHLIKAEATQARRQAASGMVSYLLGQAMLALCLIGVGSCMAHGSRMTGFVALIFILVAGLELLQGFARTGVLLGKLRHAAARVTVFVTQKQAQLHGRKEFDPDFAQIRFDHVDFTWQADRPPVLRDCDFVIIRGQRIAIIGPSGVGKSSLVSLLLKVVSPTRGRLMIDDHGYEEFDTKSLRRHVAWLSQTTHIFADTIRNNLCLDGFAHSDETLWRALTQAGLTDTVKALPEGLDHWVGEGGRTLSGGEGRRLALARILLSDASIIVLDEPTAGLDAETEQQFFRTMNHVMAGRTLIMVLHRLTGVEKLDSAWKLSDGQLSAISTF